MGHRHLHNAPQIPETDGDQGWNHTNQSYNPFAMVGALGSSPLVLPAENMTVQGGPFPSAAPRSIGHSSSIPNAQSLPYQLEAPFPHQPAAVNYLHYSSTSCLNGQTTPRIDELFHNQTMASGAHKRKAPSVHNHSDKGSTSRLHDVESSSNLHLPSDAWQKYQPLGYRANSLSVGGEHMPRNVRSRAGFDPGLNPVRTSQPSDEPDSMAFWRQVLNSVTDDGNHCLVQPLAGHGANSGAGSSFCSQYHNSHAVNRHPNGSVGSEIFNNNATSNRNLVPQDANFNGNPNQHILEFRAPSSNFHPGQGTASNERLQIAAQSRSSIQRRALSNVRLHNSEGRGRTGIPSGMHRSFTEQALMAVHHSAIYGSRNLLDRHRDMRLDVDNMSYEELILLGERIGSVGTGLSDSSISKCLTESIYCAPDQCEEDDERCVICLEEYKHMDEVGNLKCRHDFHVVCIRKWLSLKNICPICKSAAMD